MGMLAVAAIVAIIMAVVWVFIELFRPEKDNDDGGWGMGGMA